MADDPAPLIAYAPPGSDQPADRLLRRIVAWAAIWWGGDSLLGTALHVALAKGWVASPPTMSWTRSGGFPMVVNACEDLAASAILVGGVLLLWRSRAALPLLRVGAASAVVLIVLAVGLLLRREPIYASYWSTPAAAVMEARPTVAAGSVPVAIILLTLPPLARRML